MAPCSSSRATSSLALLSLVLQGCAGLPAVQTVRVETPGCAHAACELRNDSGLWRLPSAPGAVTLTTSESPLRVSCRAEGNVLGTAGASSSVPPTTGGGAVVGGVAGGAMAGAVFGGAALAFIPMLGVILVATSIATGAAAGQVVESHGRTLSYPDPVIVPMSCPGAGNYSVAHALPGVPLGLGIRGLSSAQAREAGLGERAVVLVTRVVAGGRADAAGLRLGDVVLSAGGQELNDATDLEERTITAEPGVPLTLRVHRDGKVVELMLVRPPVIP